MTAYTTQVNVTDGFSIGSTGDNQGASQVVGPTGTGAAPAGTSFTTDAGDVVLCDYLKLPVASAGSAWFRIPVGCRIREIIIDSDTTLTAGNYAAYLQPSEQVITGQIQITTAAAALATSATRTTATFAAGTLASVDNSNANGLGFRVLRLDVASVAPTTGNLYIFISYAIRSHA